LIDASFGWRLIFLVFHVLFVLWLIILVLFILWLILIPLLVSPAPMLM